MLFCRLFPPKELRPFETLLYQVSPHHLIYKYLIYSICYISPIYLLTHSTAPRPAFEGGVEKLAQSLP